MLHPMLLTYTYPQNFHLENQEFYPCVIIAIGTVIYS